MDRLFIDARINTIETEGHEYTYTRTQTHPTAEHMSHPAKQTYTPAHKTHTHTSLLKREEKPLKFQHIAFAMRPAGNHRPSPPVK